LADAATTRRAAESWFVDRGLPYFVDAIRDRVRMRLSRSRLLLVTGAAAGLGVGVGIALGLLSGYPSIGVTAAATVALLIAGLYAARALNAWTITRWALRRTFGSLGLLFPLATRALPMLLLFVTFLFINTEVWQVASHLDGGVLGGTVLLFGLAAIGFLLVRLDEELDQFDDEIDRDELVDFCRSTPLEAAAVEVAAGGDDLGRDAEVHGLEKANLVLVLLIAQAVQVLLLSVAVFAFFLVFGAVAIDDDVVRTWIGTDPTYLSGLHLVSRELVQVSVFLAAFSGLYFTVYAVTDANYRKQFFTSIMRELAQVVSARVVYRELRRRD
jgi:hypothetical protein